VGDLAWAAATVVALPASDDAANPPEPTDDPARIKSASELWVGGDSGRGYFSVQFDGTQSIPVCGIVYGLPLCTADQGRNYELEGVTAYLGTDGLTHFMVMLLHNEIWLFV
jgi:hypothetical protein